MVVPSDEPAGRVPPVSPGSGLDYALIYRFMDAHHEEHRIVMMARVLGVSRSGYYAWKTRPPSRHDQVDELLRKEIASLHARHRGRYGAPRIRAELLEQGWRVGRNRISRLMRELGIRGAAGRSPRPLRNT